MARPQLPVIDIGGTAFFLDMRLQEFRQVDNPFNSIGFVEFLETEKGLSVQFDLSKRTVFHGSVEEGKLRKAEIKLINLPPLWKMDPVGWIQHARDSSKAVGQSENRMRR
jgi:hypothetical protein